MRLVKESKLAKQVLAPFEDRLVSMGYVGNVDVNCIVDEDGTPWPLEFTMRLGWPAFNIEPALHSGDIVEFLAGLCEGKPPNMRRMNEVAVGVVISLPPYPHSHAKTEEVVGVPIWGMVPSIEDRVHLVAAQMEKGELATAGDYVCVCTGTGDTVQAARNAVYRTAQRLQFPIKPQMRIDIGQRLARDIPRLQEHGFAKGLEYA
jgi:phosphoribosylamine--glycine ligase